MAFRVLGHYVMMKASLEEGDVFSVGMDLDGKNQELLAVKLSPLQSEKTNEVAQNLKNEALVSSHLAHPNLAQGRDFFSHDGRFALVREYVSGFSLKQVLMRKMQSRKGFTLAESIFLLLEVCEGLNYLHSYRNSQAGVNHGIVHGDLTPANILLSFGHDVKLIDFGLSRAILDYMDPTLKTDFASLFYVSLRRLNSKTVARSDDIVSLGMIFWELITNRRYYDSKTPDEVFQQLTSGAFVDPRTVRSEIPEKVASFIQKCIVSDSVFGYSSIAAVHADLQILKNEFAAQFNPSLFWKRFESEFADEIKKEKEAETNFFTTLKQAVLSHQKSELIKEARTPEIQKFIRRRVAELKSWATTFTPQDRRLIKFVLIGILLAELANVAIFRMIGSNAFQNFLKTFLEIK